VDGSTAIHHAPVTSSTANGWAREFVPWSEEGWLVVGSNAAVTQAQFQAAISSLDAMFIAMGQIASGDTTDLDNVVLATPASAQRQVSLNYKRRKRTFAGTIFASDGDCRPGKVGDQVVERVTIRRVRRGSDPILGRATASADGSFRLKRDAKRGRYYATVPDRDSAQSECSAATSPRVSVR
jgi:hypothetical protein